MREEFKQNIVPKTPEGLFYSSYLGDVPHAHDMLTSYPDSKTVLFWTVLLLDPVASKVRNIATEYTDSSYMEVDL